jgi:ketosteroid isomerase-like protein
MYRFIVKRLVRRTFRRLSKGDSAAVVGRFTPTGLFVLSGSHALGGERHGPEAVRRWFRQAFQLFPGLQLEPQTVLVNGWPWNTVVATHLIIRATLRDGRPYRNEGMQLLRLRWGRVVEDRIYEDTQKLEVELQRMAREGVPEAVAPAAGSLDPMV